MPFVLFDSERAFTDHLRGPGGISREVSQDAFTGAIGRAILVMA